MILRLWTADLAHVTKEVGTEHLSRAPVNTSLGFLAEKTAPWKGASKLTDIKLAFITRSNLVVVETRFGRVRPIATLSLDVAVERPVPSAAHRSCIQPIPRCRIHA